MRVRMMGHFGPKMNQFSAKIWVRVANDTVQQQRPLLPTAADLLRTRGLPSSPLQSCSFPSWASPAPHCAWSAFSCCLIGLSLHIQLFGLKLARMTRALLDAVCMVSSIAYYHY
jgi:hypothetical protein